MNLDEKSKKIKEQIIDTPEGYLWMEVLFNAFKDLTHYDSLLFREAERTAFKKIKDRKTGEVRWQTPEEHERAVTNYYSSLKTAISDKKRTIKWISEFNEICRLCCWLADITKEDMFRCIKDPVFAEEVYNHIDIYFRTLRRGANYEVDK